MKRQISSLKAAFCVLVFIVCSAIVYGMLKSAAYSGGIAELIVALIAAVFGIAACWAVLASGPRVKYEDDTQTSDAGPWGERPSTDLDRPSRDIGARMGMTVAALIIAGVAGTAWLVMSMYGTSQMLFLGWSWIAFFAAIAVAGIWIAGPKNE